MHSFLRKKCHTNVKASLICRNITENSSMSVQISPVVRKTLSIVFLVGKNSTSVGENRTADLQIESLEVGVGVH